MLWDGSVKLIYGLLDLMADGIDAMRTKPHQRVVWDGVMPTKETPGRRRYGP
jgi:hypothetical protein